MYALAADTVTVVPTLNSITSDIVNLVLTVAIPAVVAILYKWTGVYIQKKWQDDLHRAAQTGIDLAISELGARASRSAIIQHATSWVHKSVPGSIEGLKAGPDKIEAIVVSKAGPEPLDLHKGVS